MAEYFLQFPARARGSSAVLCDGHPFRIGWMRRQRGVNFSLFLLRPSRNQRQVLLFHLIILELMGEVPLCFQMFGEDQYAARVFVQAVNDSKPGIDAT